ncbi:MAG: helix-turn-helix transcriptional regulator [Clostridia bacterium]|nr:helix-turn-helix transcriptional regulator [Clostridia bacterium]
MEFNEKLQQLRKQKGMTQEAVAAQLYVSRAAVSKWESGRGTPNLDSLKAIAALYGVTIDALLSGEELQTAVLEAPRQKEEPLCDPLFGLLDCSAILLFFLPFFGQRAGGLIKGVPLLSLTAVSFGLRSAYAAVAAAMVAVGLLTLALQNRRQGAWPQRKRALSLAWNGIATLLFIIGRQPYAAAFLFIILGVKWIALDKQQ